MKKLLLFLLLSLLFGLPAGAVYDGETDYTELMLNCAVAGDWEMGQYAQFGRMAKEPDGVNITFEDLFLLAKIIYAEAGSYWLSDEWKMAVGEVVLNRVASPLFPNSIAEVVYQPGQYQGSGGEAFAALLPDRRCVGIALRLLMGERVLHDETVLFQANFRQGSRVHTAMHDSILGWTYFCCP